MKRTQSDAEWVWMSCLDGHEPNPANILQNSSIETASKEVDSNSLACLTAQPSSPTTGFEASVSTEESNQNLSDTGKPEPSFGKKAQHYPFGYGYCQCGCGQTTRQFPSGVYSMYVENHRRKSVQPDLENSRLKVAIERIYSSSILKRPGPPPNEMPQTESRSAKTYVDPDKTLVDLYLELSNKHQKAILEVETLVLELDMVAKLVKDFWKGSEEGKQTLLEKLNGVISRLRSFYEK